MNPGPPFTRVGGRTLVRPSTLVGERTVVRPLHPRRKTPGERLHWFRGARTRVRPLIPGERTRVRPFTLGERTLVRPFTLAERTPGPSVPQPKRANPGPSVPQPKRANPGAFVHPRRRTKPRPSVHPRRANEPLFRAGMHTLAQRQWRCLSRPCCRTICSCPGKRIVSWFSVAKHTRASSR